VNAGWSLQEFEWIGGGSNISAWKRNAKKDQAKDAESDACRVFHKRLPSNESGGV